MAFGICRIWKQDNGGIRTRFLNNRPNPFNQLITVYAIRVSKNKAKKVICIPDVMHNNVTMLDAKMEHLNDGTIMKLQFSGYCRGCKVNFFVEE